MKGFLIRLHVLPLLLLICVTFEVQLPFSCEPLGLNYFAYLLEYSGLFTLIGRILTSVNPICVVYDIHI